MDRDEPVATQDVTGANLMLGLVSGKGSEGASPLSKSHWNLFSFIP